MKDKTRERLIELINYVSGGVQKDFAEKIKTNRVQISQYLNGERNPGNIFFDKVKKKFPEINVDYLKYGDGSLTLEKDLKDLDVIRYRPIPLYGRVYCGKTAAQWIDNAKDFISMPDLRKYKETFGLIATGDSMLPYIQPKDILICVDKPELIKENTAVVIVLKSVDTVECNAKLYKYDAEKELVLAYSINTKGNPPLIYNPDEILKIYKVIKIIRDVR